MRVTPMGRYAPLPAAGGACNGYLLRAAGTTVLVDGGPGVAAKLQRHVDVTALDAVVVSHLHEDHISDLHCLRFAIAHAMESGGRQNRLPIYAPDLDCYQREWLYQKAEPWVEFRPLPHAAGLRIGSLHFRFQRTIHPMECYAMRITDGSGTLFYSADSAFDPHLAAFAAGADLAIVECSLTEPDAHKAPLFGHMTARQAAEFGHLAQAGRLLFTHFWPGFDIPAVMAEAHAINPAAEALVEEETYLVRT